MTEGAAESDGAIDHEDYDEVRDRLGDAWVNDGNTLLAILTGTWDAGDLDPEHAPGMIRRQLAACDGRIALMLPASTMEPYRRWVWFDADQGWRRTDEARAEFGWRSLPCRARDLESAVRETIKGGESPVPILGERMPPEPVGEVDRDA